MYVYHLLSTKRYGSPYMDSVTFFGTAGLDTFSAINQMRDISGLQKSQVDIQIDCRIT